MTSTENLEYLFIGLAMFSYILFVIGYVLLGNSNTILLYLVAIVSIGILLNIIKIATKRLIIICSSILWLPILNAIQCRIREDCSFLEGGLLYQFLKITIVVLVLVTTAKIIIYFKTKK